MSIREHKKEQAPQSADTEIKPPSAESAESAGFSSAGAIPAVAAPAAAPASPTASQRGFDGVGAQAYAQGAAIALEGAETEDEQLLGHEAAHAVQQRQGRTKAPEA